MEIIPAIDILEGRCVRLYQGDYQQAEVFSDDPLAVARRWYEEGAHALHVVDLDGARSGEPQNLKVIEAIARSVPVHVQVGGGLRSRNTIMAVLSTGVSRVILGTIAVEAPQLVADICGEFPGQVLVSIDARNGKVATQGWLHTAEVCATELAPRLATLGIAGIVYTDIQRDGTLQGPNLEQLRQLAMAVDVPIIASGGISTVQDLLNLLTLEPLGVTGVIIGKALYTGNLDLKTAIRAVRYQDVTSDRGWA
ncbi:MAG: 1-(5-phosphoribosyl)-5-[(5-phosphoribosylamino)methylideneamino]imidazole-4-carboxamide isomerase [Pseudanabaenaceae cyanobacterium SKYGB_i_bin29]|nr:1-(5-phosphoribosyl)-5-[(5-phosphoribosylamino)methylideneamino]imidazole-4-carboxamide isomerase [Pseudanabaenaceae cyanobacterium SKYG29]MDW8421839.1 1-(5-phosphoribosyl)-5-[(5-phosphoribosylamino)methylideneamino]imidazole-4-carboxamide isomerase [Pseudanabaenaceae cyanobacterium SKYGB_i_bin29]